MTQHISDPTELFPHLESADLQVVQEVKGLIQDQLSSARDISFHNALLDYYICTDSHHAMDILSRVKEPLDKVLLDKLNEFMKSGSRLRSLTLLSHIVRRQPSWLYKIVQTNLFASVLQCLKTDTDGPVIMCGLLTITTLLPMIPSLIGPSLTEIFNIFVRFASWSIKKPGNIPEVYQLHLHAAIYALFHRLYGMYPWNFIEFLRNYYADKENEFNKAVMPMLERVRIHPHLITGSQKSETETARWLKMEVHDILIECAKVSLDVTESTTDELSVCNFSRGAGSRRTSFGTRQFSSQMKQIEAQNEDMHKYDIIPPRAKPIPLDPLSLVANQDLTAMMWSPSDMCGLTTPPFSKRNSPTGSTADVSFNSSLHFTSAADTPTPQTTPRESPHLPLSEDLASRLTGISEGTASSKSNKSALRLTRGKGLPALKTHLPFPHRTTSAPTTPGIKTVHSSSVPQSPRRKHQSSDTAITSFIFDTQTLEKKRKGTSKESSFDQQMDETAGEDLGRKVKVEGTVEGITNLEDSSFGVSSSAVTMKDLPGLIRVLSSKDAVISRDDDVAVNNEVLSIVTTSAETDKGFQSSTATGSTSMSDKSPSGQQEQDSSTESSRDLTEYIQREEFDMEQVKCPIYRKKLESVKDQLLEEAAKEGGISRGQINLHLKKLYEKECAGRMKESTAGVVENVDGHSIQDSSDVGDQSCEVCGSLGKSVEVTQVNVHNSPLVTTSQGFTPIRDQTMDSMDSPNLNPNLSHMTSHDNSVSIATPYAHLFPLALNQSWPLTSSRNQSPSSTSNFCNTGALFSTPPSTSRASSSIGGYLPVYAMYSPNDILDRHIELGDNVHAKELSRLPLTSKMSVNWTHFGGAPPADEVDILKDQTMFLHNQVLYERHKRQVHAERNRRLLGKTHKAKAYEELNSAMKDMLKLQEDDINDLKRKVRDLNKAKNLTEREKNSCEETLKNLQRRLAKENLELKESNQELQKLLVTHKREVDDMTKELQLTRSKLFTCEEDLKNSVIEVASTKRLKDEITWLNKELLLLGEVNKMLTDTTEQQEIASRRQEENEMIQKAMMKEKKELTESLSEKTVLLNAAKTRITELEALLNQKDVAIGEQKRILETVKSLGKGKLEAVESKYSAQKKINQHLEGKILKLTRKLNEAQGRDIFKARPYERTVSDKGLVKATKSDSTVSKRQLSGDQPVDRRSSWHHETVQEESSEREVQRTSHHTDENTESLLGAVADSFESQTFSYRGQHLISEKDLHYKDQCIQEDKSSMERTVSSISKSNSISPRPARDNYSITFSPSSPFQKVRSSNSVPSYLEQWEALPPRRSNNSWSYMETVTSPNILKDNGKELFGSDLQDAEEEYLEIHDVKTALVEDQTSRIANESLASVLDLDASMEVRNEDDNFDRLVDET